MRLIWMMVCMALLTFADAARGETLLELRFDEMENDVAPDASGHGRDARIVAAGKVAGYIGWGAAFNHEKDHLRVPHDAALGLTDGPFTISCWFKPDADGFTRKGTYELLGTAADRGPGWRLYITWGQVVFRSGEGYGEGKTFWQINSDPSRDEIFGGRWNHIAVTRDEQGVARIYLNGRLCGESDGAFAITPVQRDLSIGSYHFGYAYPFVGVVDEIVIRDRARSARRIFEQAVLGR